MKTSNKLIIAATILVLVSMFIYDYELKNEYFSGNYKNPYRDFVTLKFHDFDAVDINSSTISNAKFVQGPFKVMIDNSALRYTKVVQKGNRLQVDVSYNGNRPNSFNRYALIISCPKLTELNANAVSTSDNIGVPDLDASDFWNQKPNLVEGFKEDSLSVKLTYGSSVILSNNHIRALNAAVGIKPESGSKFSILSNNVFQKATINVNNRGSLLLDGSTIKKLEYHLADSAKLVLTGLAQSILNTTKTSKK
jgi:hypothetical protein